MATNVSSFLQRLGQVKNAVATQALNFTAERAGLAAVALEGWVSPNIH